MKTCMICEARYLAKGLCRSHYRRSRLHGLDTPAFLALLSADRCAICGSTADLVIDHCHQTATVRGLLCRRCNTVVGHIERSGPVDAWGKSRDQRCIDYTLSRVGSGRLMEEQR